MAFNNEIEKTKKEIEVLTKKLSFLEELEKTKSPAEEAYRRWWGEYPSDDNGWEIDNTRWRGFRVGYNYAQKDYNAAYEEKVATAPEEESKTLYQIIYDKGWCESHCDEFCDIVKEWIFQYDCDYATCKEYLEGYEECQTVLEERLK